MMVHAEAQDTVCCVPLLLYVPINQVLRGFFIMVEARREDLARDRSKLQPHRQETRRMTHLKTIEILICHVHLASQSCSTLLATAL
jgi:hypothetical protein